MATRVTTVAAALDYYAILGVERNADDHALKAAYRAAAKEHHPDYGGDADRFRAIQTAYDTLKDPDLRRDYDRSLGIIHSTDLAPTNSDDRRFDLEISLEKAYQGGAQEISYQRRARCENCTGWRCPACRGTRLVRAPRTLSLLLPAGVETGARLRLPGEGDAGASGRAGDLYVVVTVADDDRFTRAGRDLSLTLRVPFPRLALGGSVAIPTLAGDPVTLDIEAGTQPGTQRRLAGLGMPVVGASGHGDLYVTIETEVPQYLSDAARAALAAYDALVY